MLALLQPSFTHLHPTVDGDPKSPKLTFQPDHAAPLEQEHTPCPNPQIHEPQSRGRRPGRRRHCRPHHLERCKPQPLRRIRRCRHECRRSMPARRDPHHGELRQHLLGVSPRLHGHQRQARCDRRSLRRAAAQGDPEGASNASLVEVTGTAATGTVTIAVPGAIAATARHRHSGGHLQLGGVGGASQRRPPSVSSWNPNPRHEAGRGG